MINFRFVGHRFQDIFLLGFQIRQMVKHAPLSNYAVDQITVACKCISISMCVPLNSSYHQIDTGRYYSGFPTGKIPNDDSMDWKIGTME